MSRHTVANFGRQDALVHRFPQYVDPRVVHSGSTWKDSNPIRSKYISEADCAKGTKCLSSRSSLFQTVDEVVQVVSSLSFTQTSVGKAATGGSLSNPDMPLYDSVMCKRDPGIELVLETM